MRFLTVGEVLALHRAVLEATGGAVGVRDLGRLQAAVAQPRMTFEGQDLYPSITEKAAALCFSLVSGHPFVDGNKRVAHAAMETFLVLNGNELEAAVDDQERVMLELAAGRFSREQLVRWLNDHVRQLG